MKIIKDKADYEDDKNPMPMYELFETKMTNIPQCELIFVEIKIFNFETVTGLKY